MWSECVEGKDYRNSCVLCNVEGLLGAGNGTEVWLGEVGS